MKNLILILSVMMISFSPINSYASEFLNLGNLKAEKVGKDSSSNSIIFKFINIKNGTVNKLTRADLYAEIENVSFLNKRNKRRIMNSLYEKDGEWYFKINSLLYKLLYATVIEETKEEK